MSQQGEQQQRTQQVCSRCHKKKVEWSLYGTKHKCATGPCKNFETCPTKYKKGHPEVKQVSPEKISKTALNKNRQEKNKGLKLQATLKPTPEWSSWVKERNLNFDSGPKQLNLLLQEAKKFIAEKTAETVSQEVCYIIALLTKAGCRRRFGGFETEG